MRVLVISPHMDDETIGAGGTMLKYAQMGEKVYWLNISNAKEEYGDCQEIVNQREQQRIKVAEKLGVEEAIDLKLRPAHLTEYSDYEMIAKGGGVLYVK